MVDENAALLAQIEALNRRLDRFVATVPQIHRNQYNNSYYQCWGNRPEYSWDTNGQQWRCPQHGFQHFTPHQEKRSCLEEVVERFVQENEASIQANKTLLREQQASSHDLEENLRELYEILSKEQNTIEQVRDITLGSEKEVEEKDVQDVEEYVVVEPITEDCMNGQCDYMEEAIQENMLELNSSKADEVEETEPITIEQEAYLDIDQPTKRKRVVEGVEEDAGRIFKPSKEPPMLKLDNSLPKLFPWRPKGKRFRLSTSELLRQEHFSGSSYACCSRREHTLFKPP